MAHAVKLSNELVKDAKDHAKIMHRSTTAQIEHWAKIGKALEENPDISFDFLKNVLIGIKQIDENNLEEFKFSK